MADFERRSVLKGLGTVVASGMGLAAASGSATAESGFEELKRTYADELDLRKALREHGTGLRKGLVDAGVVDEEFDFNDLDFEIDSSLTGIEPTESDGLAGVTATKIGGTATSLGMVSTSTDEYELALYVQPERNESYALVQPTDGSNRFIVSNDGSISPQNETFEECSDVLCAQCEYLRRYWACDGDDCWIYDQECNCLCYP